MDVSIHPYYPIKMASSILDGRLGVIPVALNVTLLVMVIFVVPKAGVRTVIVDSLAERSCLALTFA